jgi:hypothetical protein
MIAIKEHVKELQMDLTGCISNLAQIDNERFEDERLCLEHARRLFESRERQFYAMKNR